MLPCGYCVIVVLVMIIYACPPLVELLCCPPNIQVGLRVRVIICDYPCLFLFVFFVVWGLPVSVCVVLEYVLHVDFVTRVTIICFLILRLYPVLLRVRVVIYDYLCDHALFIDVV